MIKIWVTIALGVNFLLDAIRARSRSSTGKNTGNTLNQKIANITKSGDEMNEINLMIEFLKHYRNNDYFLNQAITELKLAYTLCEYLDPDKQSKFEPYNFIKNGLLSPNRHEQMAAVDKILKMDGCEFQSPEKIQETLDYLVPKYFENTANAKDKRRRELLEELKALDNEQQEINT